ncbi:MAG: hypothetical protein AAF611_08220 [Bacteroidota bacterium]
MKKLIASALIGIALFACEKEQQITKVERVSSQKEYLEKNKLNIPKKGKLKGLNSTQKNLVQDWLEFNAIHENMKLINESTRFAIMEDLGQLAANIDELQQKKFPKKLDVMQIRSRFLVLKTKALKLQDDATDDSISNDFIANEIVEMNKVFTAVCYQMEQASSLDMKPEEILGDLFETVDSINKEKKVDPKTAPIVRKKTNPNKRSSKRFKKVKKEEN